MEWATDFMPLRGTLKDENPVSAIDAGTERGRFDTCAVSLPNRLTRHTCRHPQLSLPSREARVAVSDLGVCPSARRMFREGSRKMEVLLTHCAALDVHRSEERRVGKSVDLGGRRIIEEKRREGELRE